MQVILSIYI